jgi:hypothetical protein
MIGYTGCGVEKRCQDGVAVRRHPPKEYIQSAFADTRLDLLPRAQQVAEEALQDIILFAVLPYPAGAASRRSL